MELILKAKDIRVEFKGRDVLDINELEVYDYDRIGLVGANGSGKSTLLKLMMRFWNVDKGEIFGLFNFETEVTSKRVPQASYKASVTEGKFEGYNIERNRTFYTSGLFDYIL